MNSRLTTLSTRRPVHARAASAARSARSRRLNTHSHRLLGFGPADCRHAKIRQFRLEGLWSYGLRAEGGERQAVCSFAYRLEQMQVRLGPNVDCTGDY